MGWNTIPACGSIFVTVANKKIAEKMVEEFEIKERDERLKMSLNIAIDGKNSSEKTDKDKGESNQEIITLPIIIKADVIGSMEGIKHELAKITHDKVRLKIIAEGIGSINENDIKMAQGNPNILILGFNANPDKKATAMIERAPTPIQVKLFTIIYELSEFVQNALSALIPKEFIEEMTGRAKIMALFSKEKDRQVIGGKVETGTISNGNEVRIMRRETEIGRGKIRELQSKKLRVTEVAEGFEFGMMVEAKIEIAPGDRIEAVRTIEKK